MADLKEISIFYQPTFVLSLSLHVQLTKEKTGMTPSSDPSPFNRSFFVCCLQQTYHDGFSLLLRHIALLDFTRHHVVVVDFVMKER